MQSNQNLSLLPTAYRPLHIALAHCMAVCKMGDPERMTLLNKLYLSLCPIDRLMCRAELRLCRLARRGGVEAQITRGAVA